MEVQMSKIYSLWQDVVAWLAAPVCAPDPAQQLSSAEWADLPTYHPLRDAATGGGRC
jgi:hypothetical protein